MPALMRRQIVANFSSKARGKQPRIHTHHPEAYASGSPSSPYSPSPFSLTHSAAIRSGRAGWPCGRDSSRRTCPPTRQNAKAIRDRLGEIVNGQRVPRQEDVHGVRGAHGGGRCPRPRRWPRPSVESTIASTRNCRRMSRDARADGQADADLAGPLGDRDEHDVHDAHAAHDQRHAGDRAQQQRHDHGDDAAARWRFPRCCGR